MATKDKLVTLEDLNELKKHNDSEVSDLKSDLSAVGEQGYVNPFAFATWQHGYFSATGTLISNNRNISPTTEPFLLNANEELVIIPNGLTANVYTYTKSGDTYSRATVKTYSQDTTLSYNSDQYITVHFSSSSDIVSFNCRIYKKGEVVLDVEELKTVTTRINPLFQPSAGYEYWYGKCGQLKSGKIIVSNLPSNINFAIRGFSDSEYSTKVVDTQIKTSVDLPFSLDITNGLYYDFYLLGSPVGAIYNVEIFDDFVANLVRPIDTEIKENTTVCDILSNKGLYKNNVVRSIAHRGDGVQAPENTAPAYIMAAKRGFDAAENDIFLSADGVYMCWHDPTLAKCRYLLDVNGYLVYNDTDYNFYYLNPSDNNLYTWNGSNYVSSSASISNLTRTNGSNLTVSSLSSSVLKRFDVGIYKGDQYAGTTMLTMEEWVLLCKKLGLEIYIDTKISHSETVISDWMNILDKYGMRNSATWLGVFIPLLQYLRGLDENARVAFLTVPTQDLIDAYKQYNTGRGIVFNPEITDITTQNVKLGVENGFSVECWYANNGTEKEAVLTAIRGAVEKGVTGMSLDHYRVEDAFSYLFEES